jgi:hypothetical protein
MRPVAGPEHALGRAVEELAGERAVHRAQVVEACLGRRVWAIVHEREAVVRAEDVDVAVADHDNGDLLPRTSHRIPW